MLVLLMGLLSWTQNEGSCCAPIVSIMPNNVELHVGENFTLMCKFRCLTNQHVQLWKDNNTQKMLLVNGTSRYPNMRLALDILSATERDAGNYSCKTQPPHTKSPPLEIRIIDDLKRIRSSHPTVSSQLQSSAGESSCPKGATSQKGLIGQMWYWMLLGKTSTLLLTLVSLAVKYKSQ